MYVLIIQDDARAALFAACVQYSQQHIRFSQFKLTTKGAISDDRRLYLKYSQVLLDKTLDTTVVFSEEPRSVS
jgi:hypothetical protein